MAGVCSPTPHGWQQPARDRERRSPDRHHLHRRDTRASAARFRQERKPPPWSFRRPADPPPTRSAGAVVPETARADARAGRHLPGAAVPVLPPLEPNVAIILPENAIGLQSRYAHGPSIWILRHWRLQIDYRLEITQCEARRKAVAAARQQAGRPVDMRDTQIAAALRSPAVQRWPPAMSVISTMCLRRWSISGLSPDLLGVQSQQEDVQVAVADGPARARGRGALRTPGWHPDAARCLPEPGQHTRQSSMRASRAPTPFHTSLGDSSRVSR